LDGGLFDVVPEADGRLQRVVVPAVAAVVRDLQATFDPANRPTHPLPPAPVPVPEPPVPVARPLAQVRWKADNFSYQVLLAGRDLIVEVYGDAAGGALPPHRHATTTHSWTVLAGCDDVCIGGHWLTRTPRRFGLLLRRCDDVCIGGHWLTLQQGETVLVPAGSYHGITTRRPPGWCCNR